MKRLAIVALLLTVSGRALAQVNLVLNGDFEAHSYCPQGVNQIDACLSWRGIDSLGTGTNCDILDYCHACASVPSRVSVPSSLLYYQFAHSGSAYAAVLFYFDADTLTNLYNRHYLQGRFKKS